MGAKHTPGKWEAFATPVGVGVASRHGADIAHCGGFDTDRPREEEEANARLIASTPELLEACLNFKGLYDTPAERRRRANDPFYAEAIKHLRAAIAKATGEAS